MSERPPLVAILGGGDWYDASVDFLVPPHGADSKSDASEWPGYAACKQHKVDWLVAQRGYKTATENEITILGDGY